MNFTSTSTNLYKRRKLESFCIFLPLLIYAPSFFRSSSIYNVLAFLFLIKKNEFICSEKDFTEKNLLSNINQASFYSSKLKRNIVESYGLIKCTNNLILNFNQRNQSLRPKHTEIRNK